MLPEPEAATLTELDHRLFEALVPPDHYLRRVLAIVDFDALRDRLAPLYSPIGRPAIEPLVLLKLEFLQYQYGYSDRDIIAECGVNIAYRFFLGLGVDSTLPTPSLLSYFRARLGPEVHQQIFDDLVTQARNKGLVKDRLRLKDATHILANIAVPSTLGLVACVRDDLLDAARPYAPAQVAAEEAETQRLREATAGLPERDRLVHRVAHLRAVLSWVDALLERLEREAPNADRARLCAAADLAHKVLRDRDDPEASDKVLSTVDSEARRGWHHQFFDGFLLDALLDADSGLFTAVSLLAANADEAANATPLIAHEEQVHGNNIEAMSIDAIGFRGDLLEQWSDPQGLNLDVIVPPKAEPATTVFAPEQFVLDPAGAALTCPAGQTTHARQRNTNDTGWKYHFSGRQCRDCPLRAQCLQNPASRHGRGVIKNDHEAAYRRARQKATTARYQEVRREHPLIERKLGELVRWHGARRARYWGRAKVSIQVLLTAWVVNIKQFMSLLNRPAQSPAGAVRASRSAALANG